MMHYLNLDNDNNRVFYVIQFYLIQLKKYTVKKLKANLDILKTKRSL